MSRGKQQKSTVLRMMMARRLKAARFAYEENAAAMARELGVTPQVLNSYEKGRNYPDETFLARFCDLTGCPADWIFRGKMETSMPPVMAARIGAYFPELLGVEEAEKAEATSPTSVGGSGRTRG